MFRSRVGHLEPADVAEQRMADEAAARVKRFDSAARAVVTMGSEPAMVDPFANPSSEALRAAEERFRRANEGR